MSEPLFDESMDLPDPRLGSPFRPGPGVMNLAAKVGTKEAREEVYCALVDNDVLLVTDGIVDPVAAAGLILSIDGNTTDDYAFLATAFVMLAEVISERIERDENGARTEQPFVRRLLNSDET